MTWPSVTPQIRGPDPGSGLTPKVLFAPETDSKQPHRHEISIDHVTLGGIHFLALLRSHHLDLHSIRVEGVNANLDEYYLRVIVHKGEKNNVSLEGSLELDSVHISNPGGPGDNPFVLPEGAEGRFQEIPKHDINRSIPSSNFQPD